MIMTASRRVALHAAIILTGIGLLALLAWAIRGEWLQGIDRALLLSMRRADLTPIGPPWLPYVARDITALGSNAVLGLITTLAAGFIALNGRFRLALLLFFTVTIGFLISSVLKDSFGRARPDLVPWLVTPHGSSFPSGHAMESALTYLTLGTVLASTQRTRRMRIYSIVAAILLLLLVGVTRVYLGVHWASDVLGGWIAGAWWTEICWLAVLRPATSRLPVRA